MGDRGQVYVKQAGVYLYTHWAASELDEIVKQALIRGKDRWYDAEYLARIIFNEITKGDEQGTTGAGICAGHKEQGWHVDAWKRITIDGDKITIQNHLKTGINTTLEQFTL